LIINLMSMTAQASEFPTQISGKGKVRREIAYAHFDAVMPEVAGGLIRQHPA
jgi:hypothetical protein